MDEYYLAAYQWMIRQMEVRKIRKPFDKAFPIWAWYQWNGVAKRMPDLRYRGHLSPGSRGVRIKFETDDALVLLSDFDLWHYVLNYWYLSTSMAEGNRFDRELKRIGLDYYEMKPLPNEEYHRRIERSWEKIFDLDWVDKYRHIAHKREGKSIQATFWELKLEYVREVKEFMAP